MRKVRAGKEHERFEQERTRRNPQNHETIVESPTASHRPKGIPTVGHAFADMRPDMGARDVDSAESSSPDLMALDFVSRSHGEPLAPAAHDLFAPSFGQRFDDVRVHTGSEAASLASNMHASAFTVGNDIVFGQGRYAPDSPANDGLLAHELAHVVQNQRASASEALGVVPLRSAVGDASEVDASRAANAAVVGNIASVSSAPTAAVAASPDTDTDTAAEAREAEAHEWNFNHDDVDWGADAKERKQMRKQLTDSPTRAGDRERALSGEALGRMAELSLWDTTRAEGGRQIKNFERSYAVFRLPMQMTLEALGRVQDLLTAGAPQTPAEMSRAQRSVFRQLGKGVQDSDRKDVFGRWGDHTADLNKSMDAYMGVYERLQGSLLLWRSMKEKIHIKEQEARMKKQMDKLAKLQKPAQMITQVVGVFQNAMGVYGSFLPSASSADHDVDVLKAESEVNTDYRTLGQKGVSGAGKVKGAGDKVWGAAKSTTGISMESVIQWAMGDSDEIAGLQNSIANLKADIAAADERAEDFEIDAAASALSGTTKENRAAALGVGTERTKTRESAEIFAGVMGGESVDARLLTLCAEAYQELRMFAEKAMEAYGPVAAVLPSVDKFANTRAHKMEAQYVMQKRRYNRERGEIDVSSTDYEDLARTSSAAKAYGELIRREFPEWQQRANAWGAFFGKMTGSRLDEYAHQRGRGNR